MDAEQGQTSKVDTISDDAVKVDVADSAPSGDAASPQETVVQQEQNIAEWADDAYKPPKRRYCGGQLGFIIAAFIVFAVLFTVLIPLTTAPATAAPSPSPLLNVVVGCEVVRPTAGPGTVNVLYVLPGGTIDQVRDSGVAVEFRRLAAVQTQIALNNTEPVRVLITAIFFVGPNITVYIDEDDPINTAALTTTRLLTTTETNTRSIHRRLEASSIILSVLLTDLPRASTSTVADTISQGATGTSNPLLNQIIQTVENTWSETIGVPPEQVRNNMRVLGTAAGPATPLPTTSPTPSTSATTSSTASVTPSRKFALICDVVNLVQLKIH